MSVGYCGDPDTEPAGKFISRGPNEEQFESGTGLVWQTCAYCEIPCITNCQPFLAAIIPTKGSLDFTSLKLIGHIGCFFNKIFILVISL